MRMSTKGRYGMRIMLDLALHRGDGAVAIRDMAKRQEISEKYLWQVIYPLKLAGLVKSIRGASGGYQLAKPPSKITIRQILEPLEGDFSLVACVEGPESCHRSRQCAARDLWRDLGDKMAAILDAVTLDQMAEKQRGKDAPGAHYTI